MKKTIEISLETAKKWYRKGGDLKELALTAFTEKELDEDKIEWDYDRILAQFEKKYPIGTVVWSNDGTDNCPNIIISKPYLKKCDCIYSSYPYNITNEIVFDTMRVALTSIWCSRIRIHDKRGLEEIKITNHSRDDFNYGKFKETIIQDNNKRIERNNDLIKDYEKNIERCKKEISEDTYEIEHFDELWSKCYNEALNEKKLIK